jgi:hypothetical protein
MIIRKNDGRKLNRDAEAQIRITAVQRVLNGESPEDVVKSIISLVVLFIVGWQTIGQADMRH